MMERVFDRAICSDIENKNLECLVNTLFVTNAIYKLVYKRYS